MARTEQISCDSCGELKKQSNHWFKLWVRNDSNFTTFEPPKDNGFSVRDLCGEKCFISFISYLAGELSKNA